MSVVLLEPGQVVGPREPRNSIERVERRGTVQRLVPRAEAQRDVAAFRPRRHRLRRAQLTHARDRAPDAGLAGLGAIDHVDLADSLALERVRDRQAAMAAADDHDVVVGSRARAHPVGGLASGPAQHAGRLRVEFLARVGRGRRRRRTLVVGCRLCERGTRAESLRQRAPQRRGKDSGGLFGSNRHHVRRSSWSFPLSSSRVQPANAGAHASHNTIWIRVGAADRGTNAAATAPDGRAADAGRSP